MKKNQKYDNRMSLRKNLVPLILAIFITLICGAAFGLTEKTAGRPNPKPVRVIIQLSEAPLAQYHDSLPNLKGVDQTRSINGHIDVSAAASKAYVNYLKQQQSAFAPQLLSAVPGARVQQHYQIGFNGMAAVVPSDKLDIIRKIPGVKAVTETYRMEPELDESKNLINLHTLWAALPPGDPAGHGHRFALIDSGVNAAHPFFTDTGFTAPAGYPKSYRYDSGTLTSLNLATYTNNKVIVANVYVQPGDTSTAFGFPYGNGSDHGDHVAGIGAGVEGTYSYTVSGFPFSSTFSGQAPGAYIMSYRVTGDTAEFLAAVEDVIADQADAVNLSLGHSRWVTTDAEHDPIKEALEAAFDAGVVVCGSAGNAGANGEGTITGVWKYSPKVIAVANSTHARIFTNPVSSTLPAGPQNRVGIPGGSPAPGFGSALTAPVGLAPGGTGGDSGAGCTGTMPAGSMTGKICIIQRGVCAGGFAEKQASCFNAGGVGFIVYNQAANAGAAPITMGSLVNTIPGVQMTRADGLALVAHFTANPSDTLTIGTVQRLTSGWPDLVDSSSSQGPTGINTIKPDIAAPGTNVLSSVVDATTGQVIPGGEFAQFSGTSMSTPHITGLAVLTRALHPTWTPAQVKSAIMNTAQTTMWLDVANTVPALAKHRGAGRVQADKLIDPSLTFDPPSVSFGILQIGQLGSVQIQSTDMRTSGLSKTWNLTVSGLVTDPNVIVTTSSPSYSTLPGQGASFNLNVTTAGAAVGAYEGFVNITDGIETFHIPYWVRLQNPAHKDVLLVDWDRSPAAGFPNYQAVFTSALTTLGLTFDVFGAGSSSAGGGNAGVSLATLQNYKTVILMMGDNFFEYSGRHTGGSFPFEDYLVGGGHMIMIGQDLASNVAYSQNTGTDFTFTSMAGWIDDFVDIYPIVDFTEQLNTKFSLMGELADASANLGGDGQDNQFFPDAGRAVRAEDRDDPNIALYNAENIAPHARVLGTYVTTEINGTPVTLNETAAATGVAPDFTLENEQARVSWRAALIHVGIEGLNTNLGDVSVTHALGLLYDFVNDEVSATLNVEGSGAARDLTCVATSQAACLRLLRIAGILAMVRPGRKPPATLCTMIT